QRRRGVHHARGAPGQDRQPRPRDPRAGVRAQAMRRGRAMKSAAICLVVALPLVLTSAAANEPVASYIFPAGGQRGTTCPVRVGGLFLQEGISLDLATPGLRAPQSLKRVPTVWFEGPLVPLPESQLAEDYPRDFATQIEIAADAPLGPGYW